MEEGRRVRFSHPADESSSTNLASSRSDGRRYIDEAENDRREIDDFSGTSSKASGSSVEEEGDEGQELPDWNVLENGNARGLGEEGGAVQSSSQYSEKEWEMQGDDWEVEDEDWEMASGGAYLFLSRIEEQLSSARLHQAV